MKLAQNYQELENTISKLVAKAWIDDDFRQTFISKPVEILREAGLVIGDFVKVIVKQNANDAPMLQTADGGAVYEINLPPKPEGISDEKISAWAKAFIDFAPSVKGSC
jgi:hypothetical protein